MGVLPGAHLNGFRSSLISDLIYPAEKQRSAENRRDRDVFQHGGLYR